MNKTNKTVDPLNFIDLFSGAGGLSTGLEIAGLRCVLGVDMDKNAIETFKANHQYAKTFCGSIVDLDANKLKELIGKQTIHAVVGGPPCQGFSTVGIGDPKDKRNQLFKEFLRIVKLVKPSFLVIENVTGLLAAKNEKTIKALIELFQGLGYILDIQVLSSENFGVPEKRRRTIIIGSKINKAIIYPKPFYNTMVGKTFIPAKNVGDALKNLKSSDGKIYNHDVKEAQIKAKIELARINCIPEGKGIRYQADEKAYLPKKLKLNVDWENIPENRFRQAKYQRLDRKKPSPTIMTHRHNYFHPVENRYLTQREAASIQSFPNDFIFHGPLSAQWRQIGNAVPPMLAKAIGVCILKMYNEKNQSQKVSKTKNVHDIFKSRMKAKKSAFTYKELN